MYRVRREIHIKAPREAVWRALFDRDNFRDWASAFMAGSYYQGEWVEGGTLRYLVDDENGAPSGMLSRVLTCRPPDAAVLEHIGIVQKGVDDTDSPAAKHWTPARESYALADADGGCLLTVESDVPDEDGRQFFDDAWRQALRRVKEIAEE